MSKSDFERWGEANQEIDRLNDELEQLCTELAQARAWSKAWKYHTKLYRNAFKLADLCRVELSKRSGIVSEIVPSPLPDERKAA